MAAREMAAHDRPADRAAGRAVGRADEHGAGPRRHPGAGRLDPRAARGGGRARGRGAAAALPGGEAGGEGGAVTRPARSSGLAPLGARIRRCFWRRSPAAPAPTPLPSASPSRRAPPSAPSPIPSPPTASSPAVGSSSCSPGSAASTARCRPASTSSRPARRPGRCSTCSPRAQRSPGSPCPRGSRSPRWPPSPPSGSGLPQDSVLAAASDGAAASALLGYPVRSFEGFLRPETYTLPARPCARTSWSGSWPKGFKPAGSRPGPPGSTRSG